VVKRQIKNEVEAYCFELEKLTGVRGNLRYGPCFALHGDTSCRKHEKSAVRDRRTACSFDLSSGAGRSCHALPDAEGFDRSSRLGVRRLQTKLGVELACE
jgi:hypothetical protein